MQTTPGTPLNAHDERAAVEQRPRRRVVVLLVTAVLVLLADQVSKALVVAHLEGRTPVVLVSHVLDLEVVRNPGAAFGIGTGATYVFTAVAAAVVVVIARTARRLRSLPWALVLGLLLGGAVGNLADRLFRAPGFPSGHVVDWIHLTHWPVFNLADSAIVIGGVVAVVLAARGVGLDGQPERPDGTSPAEGERAS